MLQQANAETGGSEFGAVLRHRRAAAGLTQEQLAERSGLSVRTISNLERGRTGRPYRASAELLAQALRLADAEATQFIAVARGSVGNDQSSSGWDDETLRVATAPDWLLVPRQLPAGPPHFTGRSGELEMLSRMLDRTTGSDGLPIVAISGSAGVGKTALAVHWAHRAAVRFPDGQLYVDLRGFGPSATPTGHADAVRGLLGTLGVPPDRIPADPDAQGALYRSLLAGRRLLIVLDNAHDEAQVRPLLPGTPGCMVLVTSRRDLIGLAAAEGARTVKLDVLSPAEAGLLLARRLGEHRTRAELAATAELGRLCARASAGAGHRRRPRRRMPAPSAGSDGHRAERCAEPARHA